jgi:N-dimethylarginine dimethylaminohydrolase
MADESLFTHDAAAFARAAPPPLGRATARAVLLVEPTGFRLSGETASDNAYMDLARRVDPARALAQHRVLAQAIREQARLPVRVFAGDPASPDAVFCNNVFGSVPGRFVVGAMRHPERIRESRREDLIAAFRDEGRTVLRIDATPGAVAELTGPLVIDRTRGIGFHGLTERCNEAGARAMHAAFDLSRSLAFPLAAGEYHTNVVLALLAGRAAVVHEPSVGADVCAALDVLYGPHVIRIDDAEKAAFVANCIALTPDQCWMSAIAERALSPRSRAALRAAGFTPHTVEIDEIEKAGGSLRCCVAEVF